MSRFVKKKFFFCLFVFPLMIKTFDLFKYLFGSTGCSDFDIYGCMTSILCGVQPEKV